LPRRGRARWVGPHANDGALSLEIPSDGSLAARFRSVLDRLDHAAITVGDLSIHTPDLDDVFFALTSRDTPQKATR